MLIWLVCGGVSGRYSSWKGAAPDILLFILLLLLGWQVFNAPLHH